ncbi:MAG: hypothetical protein CMM76_02335 [Rhodospirillaceae bacterium]|nr:hypothetical protein [Rhodospirillaceae bacterium]
MNAYPTSQINDKNDHTAAALTRGLSRYFRGLGQVCISEFALKNRRRADIVALDQAGFFTIVEIKSGRSDFITDHKWQDYLEFCDRFYFAVDQSFPNEIIPSTCGLIIADEYYAEIIRDCQVDKMHSARRRAMTLRFARTAAQRLTNLTDQGPRRLLSD